MVGKSQCEKEITKNRAKSVTHEPSCLPKIVTSHSFNVYTSKGALFISTGEEYRTCSLIISLMNILLFLHFLHVSILLDYLQGENVSEENVK